MREYFDLARNGFNSKIRPLSILHTREQTEVYHVSDTKQCGFHSNIQVSASIHAWLEETSRAETLETKVVGPS